jgi:Uncharacterized conserved protein involved in intracellular sulfur reduction
LLYHGGIPLHELSMKFAIAVFSPAHAPSSRRALRFAEAALAGGHEIARLFFYQDGVHSASANVVAPQDEQDIAPSGGLSSISIGSTQWCASPLPCAVVCSMTPKPAATSARR